ncbi:hypothetical protein EON63_20160 [archaeon]|nr:MAG: hypothetical protein EON63_20160 [archaeon]
MKSAEAFEKESIDDYSKKTYVKAKLTCVMDCSQAKRNILHYFAMFFWGGWTFYYFAFMFIWPFLLYYAQGVFTCIVALGIISAFAPIDVKKQPKVNYTPLSNPPHITTLMYYPIYSPRS